MVADAQRRSISLLDITFMCDLHGKAHNIVPPDTFVVLPRCVAMEI
jgi:hypothetical protein